MKTSWGWIAAGLVGATSFGLFAACTSSDNTQPSKDGGSPENDGTAPPSDSGGNGDDGPIVVPDAGTDANPCPGQTLCGSSCVSTQSDPLNCGACGASCEAGAACGAGHCVNVAGGLQGLQWDVPCTSADGTDYCFCVNPAPQTGTVLGLAGATYEVTLRFRGVVETNSYLAQTDGSAGAQPDAGGPVATGTNGSFFSEGLRPQDASTALCNNYTLSISDPPQVAFLNVGTSDQGYCYPMDYTVTLPMKTGATVTLAADAIDDDQANNHAADGGAIIIPGLMDGGAYNGQFIQMDVLGVVPQ